MKVINQQVIDNAIAKREQTLRVSAYTIIGLGFSGMLFFMFSFLFNPHGREAEAQILGFVFTTLIFAFGASSLTNLDTKKK